MYKLRNICFILFIKFLCASLLLSKGCLVGSHADAGEQNEEERIKDCIQKAFGTGINETNSDKRLPLEELFYRLNKDEPGEPVVPNPEISPIQRLLRRKPKNENAFSDWFNMLLNNPELNLTKLDPSGTKTYLHTVIDYGTEISSRIGARPWEDIFKRILLKMKERDVPLTQIHIHTDGNPEPPLHYAIEKEWVVGVKLLLNNTPGLKFVKNSKGQDATEYLEGIIAKKTKTCPSVKGKYHSSSSRSSSSFTFKLNQINNMLTNFGEAGEPYRGA